MLRSGSRSQRCIQPTNLLLSFSFLSFLTKLCSIGAAVENLTSTVRVDTNLFNTLRFCLFKTISLRFSFSWLWLRFSFSWLWFRFFFFLTLVEMHWIAQSVRQYHACTIIIPQWNKCSAANLWGLLLFFLCLYCPGSASKTSSTCASRVQCMQGFGVFPLPRQCKCNKCKYM